MSQSEKRDSRASVLQVAAAIFWSFFGVRKRKSYHQDVQKITPVQAIIGGLVGAVILVATLLAIVYFVTH